MQDAQCAAMSDVFRADICPYVDAGIYRVPGCATNLGMPCAVICRICFRFCPLRDIFRVSASHAAARCLST